MKMISPRWLILASCLLLMSVSAQNSPPSSPAGESLQTTLYAPDPSHLWNRLYAALFLRVDATRALFGLDSLDPLFWTKTGHLLSEPSYGQAIRVMDEFIAAHGEKLFDDPLKRAMLQRDLWAAFEWSARVGRIREDEKDAAAQEMTNQLQTRLATIIKRIALSKEQIDSLPDNYAAAAAAKAFAPAPDPLDADAPFLPPDLFDKDGPWVCLGNGDERALASQHVDGCSGRSAFFAFLRLPGGRASTLAYLNKIKEIKQAWVPDPHQPESKRFSRFEAKVPNPETPQIPVGTMVALVRQTLLIDQEAKLIASPLTESVQLRVYRRIVNDTSERKNDYAQNFFEFVMSRGDLFGQRNGGLRMRRDDESDFSFGPQMELTGSDPFEGPERVRPYSTVMASCVMCHRLPGVYSVNSVANLFGRENALRSLCVASPSLEKQKALRFKEGYYFEQMKSRMESSSIQAK